MWGNDRGPRKLLGVQSGKAEAYPFIPLGSFPFRNATETREARLNYLSGQDCRIRIIYNSCSQPTFRILDGIAPVMHGQADEII